MLGMDKNIMEVEIRNGKWVKQPQELKSIFSLANCGEMQQKHWGRNPTTDEYKNESLA